MEKDKSTKRKAKSRRRKKSEEEGSNTFTSSSSTNQDSKESKNKPEEEKKDLKSPSVENGSELKKKRKKAPSPAEEVGGKDADEEEVALEVKPSKSSEDQRSSQAMEESQVEEILTRSLLAQVKKKEWSGGKKMPEWAQVGLARDLSHVGREQARLEEAVVATAVTRKSSEDVPNAGPGLPYHSIENNPSIRHTRSKEAISAAVASSVTSTALSSAKLDAPSSKQQPSAADTGKTTSAATTGALPSRKSKRRADRQAKMEAFRNKFTFRKAFTYDELDTATQREIANKGHMMGVRALTSMLYRSSAATPTARSRKVDMMTAEGARITFDPSAPLSQLKNDPIRLKLFDQSTVSDNTLFNTGITTTAPSDKLPKKSTSRPHVSFNKTYSTEFYEPSEPDCRQKSSRVHRKLVLQPAPPPIARSVLALTKAAPAPK